MKNLKKVLLVVLIFVFVSFNFYHETFADLKNDNDYYFLTIENINKNNLVLLYKKGFDITFYNGKSLSILTDSSGINTLNSLNIKDYQIKNVNKAPQVYLKNSLTGSSFHTYEEVIQFLNDYNKNFSDLSTLEVIGKSIEGREILAIKITDKNTNKWKPKYLFLGLHHAREWMSTEVNLRLIQMLLEGYNRDERITNLVKENEIWIVPIVNPDGYAYTFTVDRMWRKNRRKNAKENSYGVDNNRNYGYLWGYDSEGSSSNPDSEVYRGTAPFSEPETQAVRDLALREGFIASISYHTFSELILYPWNYTYEESPDEKILETLAVEMAKTTGEPNDTDFPGPYDYYPMRGVDLYPTNGDTTDWLYGVLGTLAYTVELNSYKQFFTPPPEDIEPTWQQTKEMPLYLIENSFKYVGILEGKIFDEKNQPLSVELKIEERPYSTIPSFNDGHYSKVLPSGEYTVVVDVKGFEVYKQKLIIKSSKQTYLDINLKRSVEVPAPVFDFKDLKTSKKSFLVSGFAVPYSTVQIFINDNLAKSIETKSNGVFSFNTTLKEGENLIKAKASFNGKESEFSRTVIITLDTTPPEVRIVNPKNEVFTFAPFFEIEINEKDVPFVVFEVNNGRTLIWFKEGKFRGFLADLPFMKGENRIKIEAKDSLENVAVYEFILYGKDGKIGDLNFDSKIDGTDLIIFAGSFNSKYQDKNYNYLADLNFDLAIDGLDLIIFAQKFGT